MARATPACAGSRRIWGRRGGAVTVGDEIADD
jgi:hypothetical protein